MSVSGMKLRFPKYNAKVIFLLSIVQAPLIVDSFSSYNPKIPNDSYICLLFSKNVREFFREFAGRPLNRSD